MYLSSIVVSGLRHSSEKFNSASGAHAHAYTDIAKQVEGEIYIILKFLSKVIARARITFVTAIMTPSPRFPFLSLRNN